MATDDAAASPAGEADRERAAGGGDATVVGEYTWPDFLRDHGRADAADELAERLREEVTEGD